jgi:hypothetical protein
MSEEWGNRLKAEGWREVKKREEQTLLRGGTLWHNLYSNVSSWAEDEGGS